MESNKQTQLTTLKQTQIENRLTAVRGMGVAGLGEKVKELREKILIDIDDSVVITRGKELGRGRRGYRGTDGNGRRLDSSW